MSSSRSESSAHQARRARRAVWLTFALAAGFAAGTYAAPLLRSAGAPAGTWLRLAYAPLCHQQPARSLKVGGAPQAVCARCAGLYLGGVAGLGWGALGLVGRRRLRPVWLGLTLAPTLLDAALPWIGVPGLPNLPRMLLALPPGSVAGAFLALAVADLVRARAGRFDVSKVATRTLDGTEVL